MRFNPDFSLVIKNTWGSGSTNITEVKALVENGLVNKVAVTLKEVSTTATLVSTIIDDGIAEGDESITIGLTPDDIISG
ncbi:hypothetical protein NIES2101_27065 [Calothrix sp. HK-06]|nr:hypothetical protein NIES2101_27065 [Calothrix sp. HK-06]